MKKRFLSILLTVCMLLSLLPVSVFAAVTTDTSWYTGHESESSFTLTTAGQLAGLAELVNAGNDFGGKTVSLGANIDLNNGAWTPIGTAEHGFAGTFDGCGYTVTGLFINNASGNQALFGCATFSANGTAAVVRNLGVFGSVTAGSNAAGIVGYLSGGAKVFNCYSSVDVKATGGNAGGIVAFCSSAIVENCYNAGSISATGGHVGGISGHVDGLSSAKNSYSLDTAVSGATANIGGTMSGGGTYAGKLIGLHELGRADISGSKTFTSDGAAALLADLNVWVNAKQSKDYYTWNADDPYPVHNVAYNGITYPVTVTLKKDGKEWTGHGKSITLMLGDAALSGMNATTGTYRIYADGADTGVSVTVDGGAAAAEVNYYTISGTVTGVDSATITGRTVNLFAATDTAFASALGSGTVQSNGTYAISAPVLPGAYVVRISASMGSYAATAANVNVTNSAVTNADLALSAPTLSQIRVNSTTHKTSYQVGDALSVENLTILAVYTDGSTETVPVTAAMVSGLQSDAAHAGKQTLTVSYNEKTCTYAIEVVLTPYAGTQASAPTVTSKTQNSVTLTAQDITGETVEYAKSFTSAVPTTGWQDSTEFSELSAGVSYYFFARVKARGTYGPGAAASTKVQTDRGTAGSVTLNIGQGNITVNGSSGKISVTSGNPQTTTEYSQATELVITGKSEALGDTGSSNGITINTSCFVTFNSVTIVQGWQSHTNPVNITAGSVVLTLADGTTNTVQRQGMNSTQPNSCRGMAAIRVPAGVSLTINGATGVLNAAGFYAGLPAYDSCGGSGAGIGGNGGSGNDSPGENSGAITINGGIINASSGQATAYGGGIAAGIGGGGGGKNAAGGNSGALTINGGFVVAASGIIEGFINQSTAGAHSAAIGGGGHGAGTTSSGTTGMVTINGGTVSAASPSLAQYPSLSAWQVCGIGTTADTGSILTVTGGSLKAASGGPNAAAIAGTAPTNGKGTAVYKATFAVPGVTADRTAVSLPAPVTGYGVDDIKTVDTNKVYFYLPAGDTSFTYNDTTYKATVNAEGTAEFTGPQTAFTATASMSGYTYGGTVSVPSVTKEPADAGGAVTYYYNADGKSSGGTEWNTTTPPKLGAGTYYMYAVIAANGDYKACTTEAVKFTVAKATLTLASISVTGKMYDGTTACEGSLTLSGAVNSEKPAATGTFAWTSKDAGTDTFNVSDIKLAGVWGDNYALTATSQSNQRFGSAKISKKTINIPAQILVYGNLNSLTKTDYATGVGSETVSLTYTAYSKDAGAYTYSATAKPGCYILSISSANYTPGSADTLTISPMPLAVPAKTVTYNGKSVFTTDITGANQEKVTLTYTASSADAGAYQYNVQSGNSYSASLPASASNYTLAISGHGTLTISPLAAALTWDYTTAFPYDGTAKTVAASVSNKAGSDEFTLTYSDNSKTDAGNYTAKVTDLGNTNYTLTNATGISQEWSISPAALTASLFTFAASGSLTYDGSAKPAAVTAKADGNYAAPTGTVTVYYEKQTESGYDARTTTAPKDAGTYRVSVDVVANGNYQKADNLTDSSWTFTIAKAEITNHTVAQSGTLTYNGAEQTADVSMNPKTAGSQTASYTYCTTETGSYSATVPSFPAAGKHTVYYKVTAPNHEDASGSFTVTIGALALSATTITVSPGTIVYSGEAWKPTVTVKSGDKTIPAADYEVSYKNNTEAGTATVTVTAKTSNCTGDKAVDKSITAAALSADLFTFTPDSLLTFDTTAKPATVTARTNGNYAAPTGTATVYYEKQNASGYDARTATAPKDAGTYRVSIDVAAKDNYKEITNLTADSWNFTIAKAPISFAVADNSYTYDAFSHKATVAQASSELVKIATDKFAVTYQKATEKAEANQTNVGDYKIIVTLSDDNFCFIGETEETTRSHTLTDKLSITKNTVTALWKNTTVVYDGTAKSPEFVLVGLKTGDDSKVSIQLSERCIAVDTYTVTAELTGANSGNYTLTNPTGTFIIQKAPVTFTLSQDTALYDGASHTAAVTAVPSVAKAVTYRNAKGKTVAAPTDAGSYDVYAEITDSNYRHVGSTDGTAQKIGVLTIYQSSAPASYTVSFDANGGSGSTAAMIAMQAGTTRVLPTSGFSNAGKTFAGWQYGGKTYQPNESFTQPSSNVTLKALWNDKVYSIGGIALEGNPAGNAANVVVSLMLGSRRLGQTVTGSDGKYSFADVAPGVYNLVANKDGVTQTVLVTVDRKDVTDQIITMPAGKLNSVVEVKAGSPAIVVGNLEKAFTEDDKAVAQNQAVEMRLTAEAKAADSGNTQQQEIEKKAGSVGLYLDLTLTKKVGTTSTVLTRSPVLLSAVIALPAELQGKDIYTVYRCHGIDVQTLTTSANADGEKIEVSKDKTTLTIYTKNFSTYAITGVNYSGGSISYTVSVDRENIKNGTVTASPTITSSGSMVTITVKPDEGYRLKVLVITGSSGKNISVTDNKNGTCLFTMPSENVTITANFTKTAENPFTDIASGAYYYNAVLWAVDRGVTSGTSAATFYPDGICTRAQAVTFLWRAMGSPEPVSKDSPFTDVDRDAYYDKAVLWATEKGITKGTSTTTFSPDITVTRSQTVTLLHRMAGTPAAGTANPFTDVKAPAYYADAVLWAVKEGITSGTSATTFSPADGCTRAQIVTFLYRYFK